MARSSLSPAQLAYIAAKAAYDVARADADAEMARYESAYEAATAGMTPAEVEAYDAAELAASAPNPVLVASTDALRALRAAERVLLDWCAAAVGPMAKTPAMREAVEACRSCPPWLPQYAKVVDLALRLDARTV